MTTTLAHDPKNDTRYDDLLAKAAELGVLAGKGTDTLVQFGILAVNSAYDGVLDLTKDKHGSGMDDAVHAYSVYDKARAGAAVFNHKSPSGKVQAAKLRSCIKLGSWTRGGPGEPIAAMNKLLAMRAHMMRKPSEAKKLDDAYNTLLRFARFQVKQNGVVDDDKLLREFCLKPQSQQVTLEEYLGGVVKRLDDLRHGKAAGGTLSHSSTAITGAVHNLRLEINDLRTGKSKPSEMPSAEDDSE